MKAIVPVLVLAVVLVSMCVGAPTETGQPSDAAPSAQPDSQTPATPTVPTTPALSAVTIDREMTIPDCEARGLKGKVVVVSGPGCMGCAGNVDQMETVQRDLGKTFEFLDTDEDAARLSAMKLTTVYLPLNIIDCEAYLGEKSDLFLRTAVENMG